MRLVLRNYEQLSYRFKKDNYSRTSNRYQYNPEGTLENKQYSKKLHYGSRNNYQKKGYNNHYQKGLSQTVKEEDFDWKWVQEKNRQMQIYKKPKAGKLKLEGTWQYVADSLRIKDYDFLKPHNKNDKYETAQQLIKRYEENLKLNMEKHLMPKLYEDDRFIKRMAKYHISEMGPLTASFLRQGYNFLDKKLIIHLLITENVKTIKQLLLGGSFQTTECIDDEVVVHILARFQQHQRNHFLINLLPYHFQLLTGQVRNETVKSFDAQIAEDVNQRQFMSALYKSNGSNSINKLRLLWSFQRRYLHKFNLMEFLVPQLKKITFVVQNPEEQIRVNKEVNHIMTTFFEQQIFQTIFFKLFEITQTYPNFFKTWAFIFLTLSKLRAIPKLLDNSSSKELHSIFQLIKMNLPSEIAEIFMNNTIFQILLQDVQNNMALHNFDICLDKWKNDFNQPPTTLYNTPLTSILNYNNPTITLSYRQHDKSDQFATTTIVLNRKNIEAKSAIVTQSQVIHNLLKGNYQSVFDDFLMRYSLPSDFDRATKFQMKLKEADKTLSFKSKDEEALYKLKLAYNFFFIQSLPKPLKKEDLQPYKMNLGVASLLDGALFKGKQILNNQDYKQVQEFREKLDKYYKELIFEQFQLSDQNQNQSSNVKAKQQAKKQSKSKLQASKKIQKQINQNQEQKQVSQEEEQTQTQYYLNMLRTDKKQNIDQKILYLNDQVAIMLEELVKDKILPYDFFHKLRDQPRPQIIKEIRQLIKKYNKYYIKKLNRQKEYIDREEYEELRKIQQMPFESQEQRTEYALKKMKENTAELKAEVFTLRQQINQALQQWRALEDQVFKESQNQIVQKKSLQKKGLFKKDEQSQIQITIDDELQQFVSNFAETQNQKEIIESALQFKEFRKLQKQIISESEEDEFVDNEYNNFVQKIIQSQENQQEQTQIDGARDDRAVYFAKNFHYIRKMEQHKKDLEQAQKIAPIYLEQPAVVNQTVQGEQNQVEGQAKTEEVQDEGLFDAEKEAQAAQKQVISKEQQLNLLQKQFSHISDELFDFLAPISYYQQGSSILQLIRTADREIYQVLRELRQSEKKTEYESQEQSDDNYKNNNRGWKKQRSSMFQKQYRSKQQPAYENNNRGWKKQRSSMFQKQYRSNQQPAHENNKRREVGFFKKIRSGFCTANSTANSQEKTDVPITNIFDIQHIPKYRNQEVSKEFYNLMQHETHIPRIGDGNIIAKYLFLQGRKDGSKGQVDPKKIMTIQFSTVVGTRSKSYEKYIKNTLYNYPLQDYFYKSLLEDQLKLYNRNEFKMIVAHIIHFKDTISDELISLICQIAEKQLIGYSLVEIAQFIKVNGIKFSSEALQKVAKVWQRFDIINQDLLPFIKEYCAKVSIPFKTQFYSHFCRSLIITKRFDKLQALCDLVFAEIRPKPFKVSSTVAASEVQILQKAWKQRQNEQFIRLYLQLLEVIVMNLDTSKVPEFVIQLYQDYIKLRTTLNEKQLAYGMVCFCLKKDKFHQLLVYLQKHPELGTSFMYDCTLQALLSNFEELQESAERIIEASVIKNRIVLSNQQILKTITIFKKAATSNAFTKFLEHSLRFQTDIDKQQDIKKQMFYVLNHNVQEVSVAGIFNLLDFIFSEKRERERIQYRELMLAEQQKEKKLNEIQKIQKQAVKLQDAKGKYQDKTKADKKEVKHKESEVQSDKSEASTSENAGKMVSSKKKAEKLQKQMKKQKLQNKLNQNQMVDQILSEIQSRSSQANNQQFSTSLNDDEIVNTIRFQTKKHESYKRKGVRSFGKIYESVIQVLQAEEAAVRQKQEKAKMGIKEEKGSKKVTKSKK